MHQFTRFSSPRFLAASPGRLVSVVPLYLLLLVTLFPSLLPAQLPVTWSKTFAQNAIHIAVNEDPVTNQAVVYFEELWQPDWIKLDQDGNTLFQVSPPFPTHPFIIKRLGDRLYAFSDSQYLSCSDAQDSVLWFVNLQLPQEVRDTVIDMAIDGDGNVYVAGGMGFNLLSGADDGFLVKVSPEGTVLWTRTIAGTSGADDNLKSLIVRGDRIYTLGRVVNGSGVGMNQQYFAVWDTSGTLLVENTDFASSGSPNPKILLERADGNFLTVGTWNGNEGYVTLYDSAANLLWQRDLSLQIPFSFAPSEGFWAANQDLYLGGVNRETQSGGAPLLKATVVKLDSAGNFLWGSTYGDASGLTTAFQAVFPAPGGGCYLASHIVATSASPGVARFMHIESNGNNAWPQHQVLDTTHVAYRGGGIGPDSAVYLGYVSGSMVRILKLGGMPVGVSESVEFGGQVTLWPNPVSDRLHLRLEGLSPAAFPLRLRLYDLTGRPVLERMVQTGEVTLEVGWLSPGVYVYELRSLEEGIGGVARLAGRVVKY